MASSVQTSANRPMPAYERIKVDILHHIDGGTWRPGDRIPSENDLVRQFGVSRMTVNRALRELTNDGRLLRVPGTGTFVAEPDTDSGLLDIRSVDDYIAGKSENLLQLRDYDNFSEISCDITDMDALGGLVKDIDVIFHQAASKKTVFLRDPRRDLLVNGGGTFNLLELARDRGVKKFVHASTGAVYGEAIYSHQDENHPVAPTNPYSQSKKVGEDLCRNYSKVFGVKTIILRPFNIYGAKQKNDFPVSYTHLTLPTNREV